MKPRHIDDIRASIKNGIWCSSTNGNKVLKEAWNHRKPGEMILLLFSVIGRYDIPLSRNYLANSSKALNIAGWLRSQDRTMPMLSQTYSWRDVAGGKLLLHWTYFGWLIDYKRIFPIRWIVIKDVPFPRFEDISLRTGKINQLRNAES